MAAEEEVVVVVEDVVEVEEMLGSFGDVQLDSFECVVAVDLLVGLEVFEAIEDCLPHARLMVLLMVHL